MHVSVSFASASLFLFELQHNWTDNHSLRAICQLSETMALSLNWNIYWGRDQILHAYNSLYSWKQSNFSYQNTITIWEKKTTTENPVGIVIERFSHNSIEEYRNVSAQSGYDSIERTDTNRIASLIIRKHLEFDRWDRKLSESKFSIVFH